MLEQIWVIPAITFVSFWLILFFGRRLKFGGSEIGLVAVGACLVLSSVAGVQWINRDAAPAHEPGVESTHEAEAVEHGEAAPEAAAEAEEGHGAEAEAAEAEEEHAAIREPVDNDIDWITIGGLNIKATTHVDGLAIVMLFTVSVISFLVHVFSTSYMEGDRRFTHYYAALSLFTTGMFILVSSGNLLQALFGWETMGVCSFMLIGHWWEEQKNSDAALKAFFTTRTGDVGFLVGMSILFFAAGHTFDIATINERALGGEIAHTALLWAAVALFVAVIGKSAQFPLHTWLPDAMAGPTPVSALIHAATMVVAGVYLLARLYGVFWQAFDIGGGGINPVAAIGGITVLIAAALAFVQSDIKKVLAYSTVSQLGYMVLALGVGAWTAGVFHFFTHAFFKALLFLGAGSASHAVHSFDMNDMGGLKKWMPKTYWTFIIGSLALAGVFPLAGFWSKDEILLGAQKNGYQFFMIVGLIGAFMTAAYMTRCVYKTFHGEFRGHGHPHESPNAITVPLIVLAVFSVGAGLLNAPGLFGGEWFGRLIENDVLELAGVAHHEFSVPAALLSMAIVLAALGVGFLLWFQDRQPRGVTQRNRLARAGYTFLDNRYYLDHVYTGGVAGGLKGPIARGAYWINQNVIDGVVNGVGIGSKYVGSWVYKWIDQGAIDGTVNGSGAGAEGLGAAFRRIQTGRVQQYGSLLFGATALGALALVIFVSS
jgi:NADH-quinone oxidoreductase subunit L